MTDTRRQHFQISQWHTHYCLLLLLPYVTVSVSPPSPLFPSYPRYFCAGDDLEFNDVLKHSGYDGYTETTLPDPLRVVVVVVFILFYLMFLPWLKYFIFTLACSNSEESVEMRRKKETYTHVVKSTRNHALPRSRMRGYGGKSVLEHAWWRHRKWFSLSVRTIA